MNIVVLTQVTGILKPFAWIMGIILNAVYEFIGLFGVHNIALSIFVFTFVMKMLMLPLTIKQQKYTRLSSKMSPELTKIQEKYKGKKDDESLRRQQAETQEVYAKYGTSPMGGCLPLLITLPIMFALYKVVYAIPAYVSDIGDLYGQVAHAVEGIPDHAASIETFIAGNSIQVVNNLSTYAIGSQEYTNSLIDILVKFTTGNWSSFFKTASFSSLKDSMLPVVEQIKSCNNLFGLNILDTPSIKSISVIIPILAVVTQFIQGKLQNVAQPQQSKDNPAAGSAKVMTTVMPFMSGFFCLMFPIGVGVYWIATALFTIIQTIFINKYLDKTDINDMIEKNLEKSEKKKEKLGVVRGNKMAEVAKTTTKAVPTAYDNTVEYDNTSYKKNAKRKSTGSGADYKRSTVSHPASSIAANANLLAARNTVEIKKPESENIADTAPVSEVTAGDVDNADSNA